MQCQPLWLKGEVKKQQEGESEGGRGEVRDTRRSRRSRRCRVESGGAMAERLPPALSLPHARLLLLLIVIAVQTRPTAATNISCLIWHTSTLTYGHAHTHTWCRSCCPALWHPVIFFFLIRPLWLPSALYKAWQLNHLSNQDVSALAVMMKCLKYPTLSPA